MTVELVSQGSAVTHKGVSGIFVMLSQITREYNGLPDYRTLTFQEIKFFYKSLIPDLKEATKPQKRK